MKRLELVLALVREDDCVRVTRSASGRELGWFLAPEKQLHPAILEAGCFFQPHAAQRLQRNPALRRVLPEDGPSGQALTRDDQLVIANLDLPVVALVLQGSPSLVLDFRDLGPARSGCRRRDGAA
jgi:hypothetical protein